MATNQVPSGHSQNLTADGNSDYVLVTGPAWLSLSNSFGGGTATAYFKDAAGTAVAIVDGAFTVAADKVIDFPAGALNEVRVTLAGSTNPDLDVVIQTASPYDKEPGRRIGDVVS